LRESARAWPAASSGQCIFLPCCLPPGHSSQLWWKSVWLIEHLIHVFVHEILSCIGVRSHHHQLTDDGAPVCKNLAKGKLLFFGQGLSVATIMYLKVVPRDFWRGPFKSAFIPCVDPDLPCSCRHRIPKASPNRLHSRLYSLPACGILTVSGDACVPMTTGIACNSLFLNVHGDRLGILFT